MNSTIIGKVLDNYRILQNIGRGGMGFVFKAMNIKLNKIVALKMIAPALAMNESFMKRFEAEAKTLAKLENPNIVSIYDLRVDSDYAYIVMEYVEGVTLGRLIKEKGPIPWRQAMKLFNQMLNAINHAHQEGIIHRDVKPNNVLINRQGVVKITDFGLAKNQAEFGITQSVTTGGTLFYMSPEQVRGLAYTDKRSDIYALGFTLYEMLTGATPFATDHTDFDIREAIIRTKFTPPHQVNKKIPAKLGKIVDKAIAKNPDDRYQTIGEFQEALEEFYQKEDAKSRKIPAITEAENTQKSPEEQKNIPIASNLSQTVNKMKSITLSNRSKSLNRKIFYYSAASILIILLFLKITGLLDGPHKNGIEDRFLSITSIPNHSMVFVNGDSIGQTPIDKFHIDGEMADVLIMKDDYFSIDTTVQLDQENTAHLDVELKPAARLSFDIKPVDAELIINESKIPQEKWSSILVPVGKHRLRILNKGEEKYNAEFHAIQGINDPISIDLAGSVKEKYVEAKKQSVFRINSEPAGASVYLNNKYIGKTPLRTGDLQDQSYALKLIKPGFKEVYDRFDKNNLQTGEITKNLIPLTGSIEVISVPPDAQIQLNGKLIEGVTPFVIRDVRAGKNTINVIKEGYAGFSSTVDVEADNLEKINVELKRLKGKLSVQVIPWGNIFIDNELFLKEAQFKQTVELGAGLHQVRVEHPTLGTYDKAVRVDHNKITEITVNFNKTHSIQINR